MRNHYPGKWAIRNVTAVPSSSTPSSAAGLPDSTTIPVGAKIRHRTRPMCLTTGMLVGGKCLKIGLQRLSYDVSWCLNEGTKFMLSWLTELGQESRGKFPAELDWRDVSTAAIPAVSTRGSFDKCIPGLSRYKHQYEKLIRQPLQSVNLTLMTATVQYEVNHYLSVCTTQYVTTSLIT
jgi:hypothetical protein